MFDSLQPMWFKLDAESSPVNSSKAEKFSVPGCSADQSLHRHAPTSIIVSAACHIIVLPTSVYPPKAWLKVPDFDNRPFWTGGIPSTLFMWGTFNAHVASFPSLGIMYTLLALLYCLHGRSTN